MHLRFSIEQSETPDPPLISPKHLIEEIVDIIISPNTPESCQHVLFYLSLLQTATFGESSTYAFLIPKFLRRTVGELSETCSFSRLLYISHQKTVNIPTFPPHPDLNYSGEPPKSMLFAAAFLRLRGGVITLIPALEGGLGGGGDAPTYSPPFPPDVSGACLRDADIPADDE